MNDLDHIGESALTLQATLRDLEVYRCHLNIATQGRIAIQYLNADPKLPGVLLIEQGEFIGMISRRRILEQMSRPYGLELFLDRSLWQLYQYTRIEHLILAEDVLINDAVEQVLKRSTPFLDEPLIVQKAHNDYSLLDIHQLLIAHANIFQLTSSLLKEKNQQLQQLAVIDPLTGIGNRRFFNQYFSRDWHLAIREKQWITIILTDIDYFKKYNDTYGHQAGDECLCQVALVLQKNCKRATDIVARYGGEEFILSLLNTKLEKAIFLVENIQKDLVTLALPHCNSPINDCVTLSFGIASLKLQPGEAPPSRENLIKLADQALYQAKEKGRNQYAIISVRKKK